MDSHAEPRLALSLLGMGWEVILTPHTSREAIHFPFDRHVLPSACEPLKSITWELERSKNYVYESKEGHEDEDAEMDEVLGLVESKVQFHDEKDEEVVDEPPKGTFNTVNHARLDIMPY